MLDNDAARYRPYPYSQSENESAYKELEATFQSNIDRNFPHQIFMKAIDSDSHIFQV